MSELRELTKGIRALVVRWLPKGDPFKIPENAYELIHIDQYSLLPKPAHVVLAAAGSALDNMIVEAGTIINSHEIKNTYQYAAIFETMNAFEADAKNVARLNCEITAIYNKIIDDYNNCYRKFIVDLIYFTEPNDEMQGLYSCLHKVSSREMPNVATRMAMYNTAIFLYHYCDESKLEKFLECDVSHEYRHYMKLLQEYVKNNPQLKYDFGAALHRIDLNTDNEHILRLRADIRNIDDIIEFEYKNKNMTQ